MPRKNRFWESGRCYHIMLRGVDGRAIFADDTDRCRFLLLLQESSELHRFRVHAFCLMSNHIHLLLESLNDALTVGVHRFATRYAQQFNRRHKKRGYVFQGRFRSILVENECYMRRLARYIHLNPLEAGLVSRPEDYRWSSYNAYFGQSAFTWLETDRVLFYFGPTRAIALEALAKFMEANEEVALDQKEIERAGRSGIYGSEEFTRSFLSVAFCETTYRRDMLYRDFDKHCMCAVQCSS
jgi:REP-associated tyrosine transposase